MACSARFGRMDEVMAAEGFPPDERLAWLSEDGRAHEEAGRALTMMGDALLRQRVDALLVVGDRYETLSVVTAATLLRVPIIHLHGGEETEGAFDNAILHAITKLSHLHLASHPS
jgi:UDP-N-acetylglucosamine 2-epimerase